MIPIILGTPHIEGTVNAGQVPGGGAGQRVLHGSGLLSVRPGAV